MPAKPESNKVTAGRMPMMRHLVEMRDRVLKSVIAIVIGTVLGFIFAPQIMEFLIAPAPGLPLQSVTMLEPLSIYFKVSLTAGIIFAMPLLVYQLFAFASPALTHRERRSIYMILPAVMIMFLTGIAFAYYIALPPAMSFFSTFGSSWVNIQPTISSYINVVTRLMIGVGIVFETPIIIMVLTRMGLVTPQWLAARRKLWIVLAFVIAALITPTFDPINQSIIAIPLIILLELSILLARIVYKKKKEPPETKA